MSKVWTAEIVGGTPKMTDYNRADFNEWCKKHNGERVRIEPEKHPVSSAMRGYYFAAVLPVVKSTCEEWKDLTSAEMHEVLKKLLFYFETWNPKTKRMERFGRSVMADSDWNSTAKAMQYLEIISGYLATCGLEMPDPEEWKMFRDSEGLKK